MSASTTTKQTVEKAPRSSRPVPAIDFTEPKRAPAFHRPDSIHWRVYKNPIALGIGGICAVLLEFADPRIRSGVWDHSIYPVDPIGRSERTGQAAMVGVYGPREKAEKLIAGVTPPFWPEPFPGSCPRARCERPDRCPLCRSLPARSRLARSGQHRQGWLLLLLPQSLCLTSVRP